jgi:DNA-binding FadR family transcriptional regulator
MAVNRRGKALNFFSPAENSARELYDYICFVGIKVGEPLPSESEMKDILGVSKETCRGAMIWLEGAGILKSFHGARRIRISDKPFPVYEYDKEWWSK